MSDCYEKIDRFLRNNLDDGAYAEYSEALDMLYVAAPGVELTNGRDDAFESVRQQLNKLPRYSFQLDSGGSVRRIPDRYGSWIEWQSAHELFDPVAVDEAIAAWNRRAQPPCPGTKVEPSGWANAFGDCQRERDESYRFPLYATHPPRPEPLSDGDVAKVYLESQNQDLRPQDKTHVLSFARAIERAHGIGAQP